VLAHRQRLERFVAVTDLDGRGPFAGVTEAREIAYTTNPDRGILGKFAIKVRRRVDVAEVGW
jgi:hypothetical protein